MTKKIALSLPDELLRAVERVCRARKQSRSEFFRRAVLALLRHEGERRAVERYVQAYREQPETEAEIEAADRAGRDVLHEEPWE